MTKEEKTKQEVWDLYFNRLYSYAQLVEHFKDKLTYADIKRIINEKYK